MINITLRYICLLIICALYLPASLAAKDFATSERIISYENDDLELTASCYITDNREIIIFLPSVYTPYEDQENLASEMADKGLSACFSHVFTDLFLPMKNKYYNDIPLDGMLALLEKIQHESGQSVYLVAHGAGAKVAYAIAHLSQQNGISKNAALSGLILLSPNLLGSTPEPGQKQGYIPLIDQKTLPVFIFQPAYSPHHWHLDTLISKIRKAGTPVYYKRLPDARDGYAIREDRNKKEQALRGQVTLLFKNAITQMTNDE